MTRIGIISGGFDPIHAGHIAYIKAAAERCDYLYVGCNTDEWLERKKGKAFMPYEDRCEIVRNLEGVKAVVDFDDRDDSAFELIEQVHNMAEEIYEDFELVFFNGGDRTKSNIPEEVLCKNYNVPCTFEFGVGGEDKKNSSSWILDEWRGVQAETKRNWGTYKVIHNGDAYRVKELVIDPLHALSDQYHDHRDEVWNVVEGTVQIVIQPVDGSSEAKLVTLKEQQTYRIPKKTWHKAYNTDSKPAKVIEIWFGDYLNEDDITRRESKL